MATPASWENRNLLTSTVSVSAAVAWHCAAVFDRFPPQSGLAVCLVARFFCCVRCLAITAGARQLHRLGRRNRSSQVIGCVRVAGGRHGVLAARVQPTRNGTGRRRLHMDSFGTFRRSRIGHGLQRVQLVRCTKLSLQSRRGPSRVVSLLSEA